MATSFTIHRHPAVERRMASSANQWRCTRCFKLLGCRDGDRLHLVSTHGHEYLANLPVSAVCRSCGTLNQLTSAAPV